MSYFLNDLKGKHIPVGLSMRIGSNPSCDIVVKDSDVSDVHAVIGIYPDGLLIRDEDSAGGTFINDEKIEHVTALMSGDRIRMGKTEFLVEYESEAAQGKNPPDAVPVTTNSRLNTPVPNLSEPPPITQKTEYSNQVSPAQQPIPIEPDLSKDAGKKKASGGCLRIGLTFILIMLLACIVLGGGGYLLIRNGVIPMRTINLITGDSQSQVHIYNFTDKTIYVNAKEDVDENTVTIPHIYKTLKPYESIAELNYLGTGQWNILLLGSKVDTDDIGHCRFLPDPSFDYNIVILPDKVLIDDVKYLRSMDKLPVKGSDLIMATSSICVPKNSAKGGG